jgi:hypothetical protein
VALTIMDMTISPSIRGALEKKPKNAKDFMEKIEEYFKGSPKVNAMTLMSKLVSMKYNGQGSVREHILGMIDLWDKLKDLDYLLNDATLLNHVMLLLPSAFEPFKISYNTSDNKWDITTLIAKCSQEEERIHSQNLDISNDVRHEGHRGKNKRVICSNRANKDKKLYDAPKKDGLSSSKSPLCYH